MSGPNWIIGSVTCVFVRALYSFCKKPGAQSLLGCRLTSLRRRVRTLLPCRLWGRWFPGGLSFRLGPKTVRADGRRRERKAACSVRSSRCEASLEKTEGIFHRWSLSADFPRRSLFAFLPLKEKLAYCFHPLPFTSHWTTMCPGADHRGSEGWGGGGACYLVSLSSRLTGFTFDPFVALKADRQEAVL